MAVYVLTVGDVLKVFLIVFDINELYSKLSGATRPGWQTYITEVSTQLAQVQWHNVKWLSVVVQTLWLEGVGTDYLVATTSGPLPVETPVPPAQSSSSLVRKSYTYLMEHVNNHQPLVLLPNGSKWQGHVTLTGNPYKVANACLV